MTTVWRNVTGAGAIPAGGSLVLLQANIQRNGFVVANTSDTAMTVSVGATALPLAPSAMLSFPLAGAKECPSNDITLAGTAAKTYVAAEW